MKIFCNTTITNFCKFEANLDVMKCMFNFASYRGFAVVNYLFPVDSIVRNIFDASESAYYAKVNFTEMLII